MISVPCYRCINISSPILASVEVVTLLDSINLYVPVTPMIVKSLGIVPLSSSTGSSISALSINLN
jgi:hypothetical protein